MVGGESAKNILADIVVRCYESPIFAHIRSTHDRAPQKEVGEKLRDEIRAIFKVLSGWLFNYLHPYLVILDRIFTHPACSTSS